MFNASMAQEAIPHETLHLGSIDSGLTSIQDFLEKELNTSVKLSKVSIRKSKVGIHEQFRIKINGIHVHDAILKRNRYSDGTTIIQYPRIKLSAQFDKRQTQRNSLSKSLEFEQLFSKIYSSSYEWVLVDGLAEIAWIIAGLTEDDHLEIWVSQNGK
jgi:putative cell wall-binding protein